METYVSFDYLKSLHSQTINIVLSAWKVIKLLNHLLYDKSVVTVKPQTETAREAGYDKTFDIGFDRSQKGTTVAKSQTLHPWPLSIIFVPLSWGLIRK